MQNQTVNICARARVRVYNIAEQHSEIALSTVSNMRVTSASVKA